jgi:uncharacterized protein (TIGR01777 family)
MKIVIAGGSGFLGRELARFFLLGGATVEVLTRSPRAVSVGTALAWDGASPGPWTAALEGADAVINLTGRTVDCRYTTRNRREILESRLAPTRALSAAMATLQNPPRVWLNASTATIYRHTLGPAWDEQGELGATPEAKDEFSVAVAKAWEEAFFAAPVAPTRRVALRTAMVLGHGRNSVFPVLRRLARLGLAGPMGTGRQFVSWVHHSDFCRAVQWIIEHDEFEGPVNVAAPHPATNREMMRAIRAACGVPVGLPAPRWLLELGAWVLRTETELVIKSRRVFPRRLLESGFVFCFPQLAGALADLVTEE